MTQRSELRFLFLAIVGLFAVVGLVAVLRPTAAASTPAEPPPEPARTAQPAPGMAVQSPVYYCPMHPSYRSDHPGDCPICNMRLVLLEDEQAGAGSAAARPVAGRVTVTLPEHRARLIELRTSAVERQPFVRVIRAAGRVEADERKLSAVNLKVGGWVEELHVQFVGQAVTRGEALLELYSPELYEAQRKYLLARELAGTGGTSSAFEQANIASARARLELLDMTAEQIAVLDGLSEPARTTSVLARAPGVVLRREVVLGSRVEAGMTLYELADLSSVWVQAELYENELPLVAVGTPVEIEFDALPEERLRGTVRFLEPKVDARTRSASARIELENPRGRLLPGMFASVTIAADLGLQLVVDEDAILDTGLRKLAYVDLGEGRLEPREIEVGTRSEGRAVVLSGLVEGEHVVSRGTFLVDSESRLRAALVQHMQPTEKGGMQGHAH